MVWTDPEMVRTIVTNLTLNAIQAMDSTGTLTIRTLSPQGAYRLVRRDRGQMVTIQFQDTGPGITKEDLGHIFIPFYTTKSTGSGLGLSICQRVIKSLGGYIEVQSDTGAGCTFSVHFPVRGFLTSDSIPIIDEPGDD
jgi:signal transduction histidine kinase